MLLEELLPTNFLLFLRLLLRGNLSSSLLQAASRE